MKLRNKKTGDVMTVVPHMFDNYNSLSELNEDWEDYEEPKVAYFIDAQGDVCCFSDTEVDDWTKEKTIGNYFEIQEEAEKAVEKLKAWKRIKDKGFRFAGVRTIGKVIDFDIPMGYYRAYCDEHFNNEKSVELFNDLNLLFGGEE